MFACESARKSRQVGILLVLALHVVPVLQRLLGYRQTLWPIMAWGMYRESRPPRPISAVQRRLFGITAQGEEQEIHHWQSGHSSIAFNQLFLQPMWKGEVEPAQRLAEKINRFIDEPIVAFRMTIKQYTLTDSGIEQEDIPDILFDQLSLEFSSKGQK